MFCRARGEWTLRRRFVDQDARALGIDVEVKMSDGRREVEMEDWRSRRDETHGGERDEGKRVRRDVQQMERQTQRLCLLESVRRMAWSTSHREHRSEGRWVRAGERELVEVGKEGEESRDGDVGEQVERAFLLDDLHSERDNPASLLCRQLSAETTEKDSHELPGDLLIDDDEVELADEGEVRGRGRHEEAAPLRDGRKSDRAV